MSDISYLSYFKKVVFLLFCVPTALLWDLLYGIVGLLYNGMTYVDDHGGKLLEKARNILWED